MGIDLGDRRSEVMVALKRQMRTKAGDRAKLLGVKGDALAAATSANLELDSSPTMRAIERYSGVLYDVLDVGSLGTGARRRLDRSVVIFSGLFGLVEPSDRIPNYKIKMGATLEGVGRLSTYWRPAVSDALAVRARGRRVWNLLPNEHDAAWDHPAGIGQISVRFLERKADGTMVAVSHWNKYFKGALVRHLLDVPESTPESLVDWHHPAGWVIDPALEVSQGTRRCIAFVRESGADR